MKTLHRRHESNANMKDLNFNTRSCNETEIKTKKDIVWYCSIFDQKNLKFQNYFSW